MLSLTGYQFTKFDKSSYQYREELEIFLINNKDLFNGNVLDVGAGSYNFVKDTFSNSCNYKSFEKHFQTDINGDVMELDKYILDKQDLIIMLEVLEHIEDPFKAIEQIHMNLKKGGYLILSVPFNYEIHGEDYGDFWRFTRQGLKKLLSGFNDFELTSIGKDELKPHHYIIKARK